MMLNRFLFYFIGATTIEVNQRTVTRDITTHLANGDGNAGINGVGSVLLPYVL